jgi:DUF1365 family protein
MKAIESTAIYRGKVMHHRFYPRQHRFVYRMSSFLLDVDALAATAQRCRLFSLNRFNLFSFYCRDLGNGSGEMPRAYLERSLKEQGIDEPVARASLLCYPRVLGYTFNPLSVYYCYNSKNEVFAILHEVSNTFKQRHSYLLPVPASQRQQSIIHQQCDKTFYVSPFIAMGMRYHFRLQLPGKRISLTVSDREGDKTLLNAIFHGSHRPFTDRELLRNFFELPLMTLKAIVGIHWQALKLFLKGVKLVDRPPEPNLPISRIDQ